METHTSHFLIARKISAWFFAVVRLIASGSLLLRLDDARGALIVAATMLVGVGYSLYGSQFAAWPWRAQSNLHRALWFAGAFCAVTALTLLRRSTVPWRFIPTGAGPPRAPPISCAGHHEPDPPRFPG